MTAADGDSRLDGLIRAHFRRFQTYEGVDPPEVLARRAGIPEDRIIKLNGNENPYGPSPRLAEALARCRSLHLYPDPQQRRAREALADYVGLGPEHIVAGVGSDEVIDLLLRLVVGPGDRVVNCEPTFGMYAFSTAVQGGEVVSVPRDERFEVDADGCLQAVSDGAKLIFVCSPNNPTGNVTSRRVVERLLERDALVIVDETYCEFSGASLADLVPRHWNLVVLRSLSKWAGLAGIRVGFGIMSPRLVDYVLATKPPYNLSIPGEVALLTSLEDRALLLDRVQAIVRERERMAAALGEIDGLTVWPSRANFLLCQLPPGGGQRAFDGLARRGIFVRYFQQPRLEDCLRISVGLPEHTDALASALGEVLGEE